MIISASRCRCDRCGTPVPPERYAIDKWDGYAASRDRAGDPGLEEVYVQAVPESAGVLSRDENIRLSIETETAD